MKIWRVLLNRMMTTSNLMFLLQKVKRLSKYTEALCVSVHNSPAHQHFVFTFSPSVSSQGHSHLNYSGLQSCSANATTSSSKQIKETQQSSWNIITPCSTSNKCCSFKVLNFHFSARLVFASLSPFILTLPSPPCSTGQWWSDVDVDDYGGGGDDVYPNSADKVLSTISTNSVFFCSFLPTNCTTVTGHKLEGEFWKIWYQDIIIIIRIILD